MPSTRPVLQALPLPPDGRLLPSHDAIIISDKSIILAVPAAANIHQKQL
jgi:hypothetical protein